MPIASRMRAENKPRWVKYLMSESEAVLEALAIAVAISARSCDKSISASGPRFSAGSSPLLWGGGVLSCMAGSD